MTTERRVSDEVREAAAEAIVHEVRGAGYEYPTIDGARGAIDHLVDVLGWGPKPTVIANQCHCPENGLVERDICGRGHCRSCHACDCDAKPTVSRAELEALMSATVNDLAEYLRTQVGIEVTE